MGIQAVYLPIPGAYCAESSNKSLICRLQVAVELTPMIPNEAKRESSAEAEIFLKLSPAFNHIGMMISSI
jgi:hypothetical protein